MKYPLNQSDIKQAVTEVAAADNDFTMEIDLASKDLTIVATKIAKINGMK